MSAVLLVACVVAAAVVAREQKIPVSLCEGPFKGYKIPSDEELRDVLSKHRAWVESGGKPNDNRRANLCQVYLVAANLQKANLGGVNLQAADLTEATLSGANYEPNPGSNPHLWSLTSPKNKLAELVFYHTPAALTALRDAFKQAGMRFQERQITYAIEHTKRLRAWDPSRLHPKLKDEREWLERIAGKGESLFSYVAFELPSHYGLLRGRLT